MNRQSFSLPSPALLSLVLACAVIGALTSVMPLAGALVPVAVVAVLSLSRIRRPWMLLFVAFLVLQDPLLFMVQGDTTPAGFVIKRIDEGLLYLIAGWTIIANRAAQHAS